MLNPLARWRHDIAATLSLALPVMISRAGILIMVMVDTAMSGRSGASEIAYYGVGAAPLITMIVMGVGLIISVQIICAQAVGAGDTRECGSVWLAGMGYAAVLGIAMVAMTSFPEFWLSKFGQSADIVAGAAPVMYALGWGLPAVLAFSVCNLFLEALDRPLPGMVVMIAGNVLNIAANWILVFGNAGWPAMGAEGAAWATTGVRVIMAIALVVTVLVSVDRARYGFGPWHGSVFRISRRIARIGLPMSLGVGLESSAFATMTMLAGVLGATAVGAYTIAHNLNALVFMFGLGVSTAAAVRTGNAQGRHDAAGLRRAGWVAAGIGTVVLCVLGLLLLLFGPALAALYTREAAITALTLSIMPIVVAMLIPDGLQVVLIGALRGADDFWSGAIAQFVGFWVVMVPLGYWLGVTTNGGVHGLLWAVLIGAVVSSIMVLARFEWLARTRATEFANVLNHRKPIEP